MSSALGQSGLTASQPPPPRPAPLHSWAQILPQEPMVSRVTLAVAASLQQAIGVTGLWVAGLL